MMSSSARGNFDLFEINKWLSCASPEDFYCHFWCPSRDCIRIGVIVSVVDFSDFITLLLYSVGLPPITYWAVYESGDRSHCVL